MYTLGRAHTTNLEHLFNILLFCDIKYRNAALLRYFILRSSTHIKSVDLSSLG